MLILLPKQFLTSASPRLLGVVSFYNLPKVYALILFCFCILFTQVFCGFFPNISEFIGSYYSLTKPSNSDSQSPFLEEYNRILNNPSCFSLPFANHL